ncbi:hypothetical protein SAMN05421644_11025 [Allochromatium warmingii]|uniref:Uncharacterized protein n=1 Tax=Allochromatium warmingii TaxID=61595 RepID=A0A1H3DXD4_ALLWA|nr:hypothetical protein [Allochromatium warmingii]SDX70279.1 hypothetical protein SAMN05421644_11025 [Allochromatium warmingii]
MPTRSQKIRAERREKLARQWPEMKKPVAGRIHNRLAKIQKLGVFWKKDDKPLAEVRRPRELAAP